ncbi:hypothetical protein C491_06488 [Natronococcus amylolyticus DSM 10524]|uniref:Glycerophosphoryl diester phosphodiesterase membrane domain-containing protein n=1 Tax=Natronococcus amylolyticus DSM 10524 TaxID=1227497 RepID=L9XDB9_9EURY|nr:DUF6159 family protein [Natronococcus amylolyticus]ELY59436.1 hypothetical protein C491_06488 [Natronococcus amylolyticus DSM 10524]
MMFSSLLGRIRTGLRVAKASFGVLRREYWLLVFPVLYGLAWLAGAIGLVAGIFVALFGASYGLAAVDQVAAVSEGQAETTVTALLVAASVLFMFVATAIATFFSAALVHSVGSLFAGESTSLRDGLAGAWEAKRTILAWGAVGAAVGLVFRALESREGTAAQLARSVAGFAWFAMTFFIVLVIVFQDGGVRESMRNSVGLFRDTWGEAGGTTLGIGLVILPLAALVGGLGIGLPLFALEAPWAVLQYTLVPTLLAIGALLVVHNAATAVAKTALYEYATDGELPPEFDGIDPGQLVTRKRSGSSMTGSTGREPGQI